MGIIGAGVLRSTQRHSHPLADAATRVGPPALATGLTAATAAGKGQVVS